MQPQQTLMPQDHMSMGMGQDPMAQLMPLIQVLQQLPPELLQSVMAAVMQGQAPQQGHASMSGVESGLQALLGGEMGRAQAASHSFPGEMVDEDVMTFIQARDESPLRGLLGPAAARRG